MCNYEKLDCVKITIKRSKETNRVSSIFEPTVLYLRISCNIANEQKLEM